MTKPTRIDGRIKTRPVTTDHEKTIALMVRAASYLADGVGSIRMMTDGNDHQATHFIAYLDDEPIGSARVRWFRDFAKFERSCLLPAHRNARSIYTVADSVFAHIARKGYDKVITVASETHAKVWTKLLGFEINEAKPPVKYAVTSETYFELIKRLQMPEDRLTAETQSHVLERIEGFWNDPAPYELAEKG